MRAGAARVCSPRSATQPWRGSGDVVGAVHDVADLGEEDPDLAADPAVTVRIRRAEAGRTTTSIARARRKSCAPGTVKSPTEVGLVGAGRAP